MGVIQTLTGVSFNNPNLPIIPRVIGAGLIGGYRAGNFMQDISGGGNNLVQTGTPTVLGSHVEVNFNNYYDTGLNLPGEFTVISVFRTGGTPPQNMFMMGDYSIDPPEGALFFTRPSPANQAAANIHTSNGALFTGEPNPSALNNIFSWQAISLSSTKAIWMIPRSSYLLEKASPGVYLPGDGTFKIGRTNTTTGDPNTYLRVVEVLIYNRVLSEGELELQYGYSSQFAGSLGILGI